MDPEPAQPSVAPNAVYAALYILARTSVTPELYRNDRLPFVPHAGMYLRVASSELSRPVILVTFDPATGLTVTLEHHGLSNLPTLLEAGWRETL